MEGTPNFKVSAPQTAAHSTRETRVEVKFVSISKNSGNYPDVRCPAAARLTYPTNTEHPPSSTRASSMVAEANENGDANTAR